MARLRSSTKKKARGRKHAVALEYGAIEQLPKVVASASGELADQLIQYARTNQIPVREDANLTEMLSSIPNGKAITPQTFRMVAELITFLYNLDRRWREEHTFLSQALK